MLEEIIASHSILVTVFLVFLVGGLFIPSMTAKDPLAFRKASFIYTMVFQAIATMVVFTGMVAMVMGEYGFTLSIILMIVVWAVLMYIEIRKYKLIKHSNVQVAEIHQMLKNAFLQISMVQIMLVAVIVIFMLLKAKGIVAL